MSDHASNPPASLASSNRLEQAAASDASVTAIHAQLLREKPEPTEGFSPIPIFLIFVISSLCFFGGIYLTRYSAEFSPYAFNPAAPGGADAGAPKQVDPMVIGKRLFTQSCAACHQVTGMGLPNTYPPLAGSEWVSGSEDRMIRIVLHGLVGPIEVKGASFNSAMPAFGPQSSYRLNEQKIAAILTYVRGSFGNTAPAVTPEKVKEVMVAVGDRTSPWTAQELEQLK